MNMRKLSINKACVLLGVLLLLATGFISASVYMLNADPEHGRRMVCIPVQLFYTALRHLLCGTDPPEAGKILRCLLRHAGRYAVRG